MTNPTPTPAAPLPADPIRAALERLLKLRDNDTHALLGLDWHEAFEAARDALHAAALATTPPAPPLEPRGCPTPGACSCPTAPIVPPELIRALEVAEAALEDIGETLPGSGALRPRISRALLTWREHATPPAPTREATPVPTDADLYDLAEVCNGEPVSAMRRALELWGRSDTREAAPVPQQAVPREISDRELAEMAIAAGMDETTDADDDGPRVYWEAWDYQLATFARAIWDRAQAALPAADQQEGRDAAGEVQP